MRGTGCLLDMALDWNACERQSSHGIVANCNGAGLVQPAVAMIPGLPCQAVWRASEGLPRLTFKAGAAFQPETGRRRRSRDRERCLRFLAAECSRRNVGSDTTSFATRAGARTLSKVVS